MSSAVEQIIRPFLAKVPSKAEIDAAEQAFEAAKRDQPVFLVEELFKALKSEGSEVAAREQVVVLLRKCFEKATVDDASLWNRLGAGQAAVQDQLLQVLQAESVPAVRKKVADCVQALGNQLINIEEGARPNNVKEWPDLMPTLMRVIVDGSKDSALRGDCLYIVKELIFTIWQVMLTNGTQTLQVLTMCLQDASEVVCGNALAMLIEMMENVPNKEERKPFAVLLPAVSKVVQKIASVQDTKPLKDVLTILGNQTEVTRFLKDILAGDLMPCLCTIAKGHQDEDVQKLAMEAVVQVFNSYPAGTVSQQGLIQQALEVCTQFMLASLSDDVDEWKGMDDDDEFDEEERFRIGRDNLDRLCKAAQQAGQSGKQNGAEDRQHLDKVLEYLKPALATLFNSGQWKETVCGLTMFQQIIEYVDDEDTVTQLLGAVQAQLKATHPRVRHMAWTCISQFAVDHIEVLTAEPIVGSLMELFPQGLQDPIERVCCRSMEAFQHFGESVEREDMEPFVKPMMTNLAPLLKGSVQCQRKAITTIAVVAGQVEDGFAEYYPDLMPYLKGIIGSTLHKVEERTLLGKCFECISLLAKAIGRKGFRQDAEHIMEAMIKATQVPNLPSNDPVKEYMMAASQRICAVMKEDFVPMIPHILPGILEKFTLAPKDFQTEVAAGDLDEDSEVTLTMTKLPDGQVKFLFMSTSDMEDLLCALQCVHTFVEELGANFAQFVPDTAKALVPVFDFNIDEEIRDLAFETWGNLCKCSRDANQIGQVGELVMAFLKHVVPAFEQSDNLDLEALKTKSDGITCILKKAGPNILQPEQVNSLCQLTVGAMMKSFERRKEALEAKAKDQAAGGKEDDEQVDDGSLDDEEALRIAIAEVAGALMKHHPEAFVSCGLEGYLDLVVKLQQSNETADRKLILFIACDFLDHLSARVVPHWQKFMPMVMEDILCPDAARRQPACYGISLAAREASFAPVALEAAKKLQQVVTMSRGRAKKKSERPAQACADNALSGLIVILETHKEALGASQGELWDVWLQGLPCQEDEEEGVKNHKNLLKFVIAQREEVLKQGASNFPKVLAILVDQYKTPMVDDESNKGIQQLVLNLGQAKLEQFAASLSEKQKKKLLRVHRDSTAEK
jgi:hypothetical protein